MKKKEMEKGLSFCDLPSPAGKKRVRSNSSAFYRHRGEMRWTGVADEPYKAASGGWTRIMRRVLVGNRGESARFHVRYFEIAPEGYSSLERHRHEHVVICVKGRGVVRMGRRKKAMNFMDTVYIAPGEVHQLLNPHGEPFGFLCIVNARRDRPKPVGGPETLS
jgi:ribulose-bisphosphate carboxylase large chain